MHIQTDRAFVPAGTTASRYLSVTLTAPVAPTPEPNRGNKIRPGVDVSLVLDRSGSMAGRKIDLARRAVGHAIRLLNPNDRLNVVVYDHEVETLLESTAATPAARKQALAALARIDARGSTNLAEGWFTGARALGASTPESAAAASVAPADPRRADRIRRVLLLTDGLANQGMTEPEELRQAAARLRAQGIGTTTFGLGEDFDEELLTSLAAEGGGHFYFIEQPEQIPDAFASELGEVLDIVARDVVFEISAGQGIEVAVLNPLPVEQDGAVTRVRLGDFVAEQELTLLVAVQIGARAVGEAASISCRVHDRSAAMVQVPMQMGWTAVPTAQDQEQPVNTDLLVEVARMLGEAARLRALHANRRGDFDDARQGLQASARQIEALGVEDEALRAVAALLQDEEVAFGRHMDAVEMKMRHYAAYSVAYSREPEGKARRRKR